MGQEKLVAEPVAVDPHGGEAGPTSSESATEIASADPDVTFPAAPPKSAPIDSTRRWALVVVLAFAVFHGPYLKQRYEPNTWLFADGAFYFATVRAISEHGRLEQHDLQPDSWYAQNLGWNVSLTDDWSNVSLGKNGGWYPKHAILLPLLSAPLYLLFGMIGTLATNVGINLLFVLLVFLLARRVARPWVAAIAATIVAANPFVQGMSYTFSNDVLGADLVLGAMEAALAGSFGLGGVLAGLAVWSRLTNAAFLLPLALVGWEIGGQRGVLRAALFSLIPLSIYGALNTYIFGLPWITSYQSVIVREGGFQRVASHTRLFNVPWRQGFDRIVNGEDGGFKTFRPLAPGLIGLLAIARRRPWLAVATVLFCTIPVAVFMTYDWYRPHFLYPIYGASAMGLAALVELFLPARPLKLAPAPPISAGWRLALVSGLVVAVVVSATSRYVNRPDPSLLSSHIREAVVRLDQVPCDYWNVQNERWECSHYDGDGNGMTGAILGAPVMVHGQPHPGIWMHPNPTRRWRHVTFPKLDASAIDLELALGDQTRAGLVQVELRARGQAPVVLAMEGAGQELHEHLAIAAGDGPALEIRFRADDPSWKHLVVDGKLVR